MLRNNKQLRVACFGEVLWDIFDNGKKIGGAPLNVALRMKSLGCDVAMISAVGCDDNGKAILDYLLSEGLNVSGIHTADDFPTGLVMVQLDANGSASYDIHYPSAWDKISYTPQVKQLVDNTDVLIYGSLACRDEVSKKTLLQLLENDTYKVFDVNLRKPHYNMSVLKTLMQKADFIKLNDEELPEIAAALGSESKDIKENMRYICKITDAACICVTLGKNGAILLYNSLFYSNTGYPVTVADTVGAGDSFLAALISCLFKGSQPQEALNFACATGALVASKPGANPVITIDEIQNIIM